MAEGKICQKRHPVSREREKPFRNLHRVPPLVNGRLRRTADQSAIESPTGRARTKNGTQRGRDRSSCRWPRRFSKRLCGGVRARGSARRRSWTSRIPEAVSDESNEFLTRTVQPTSERRGESSARVPIGRNASMSRLPRRQTAPLQSKRSLHVAMRLLHVHVPVRAWPSPEAGCQSRRTPTPARRA